MGYSTGKTVAFIFLTWVCCLPQTLFVECPLIPRVSVSLESIQDRIMFPSFHIRCFWPFEWIDNISSSRPLSLYRWGHNILSSSWHTTGRGEQGARGMWRRSLRIVCSRIIVYCKVLEQTLFAVRGRKKHKRTLYATIISYLPQAHNRISQPQPLPVCPANNFECTGWVGDHLCMPMFAGECRKNFIRPKANLHCNVCIYVEWQRSSAEHDILRVIVVALQFILPRPRLVDRLPSVDWTTDGCSSAVRCHRQFMGNLKDPLTNARSMPFLSRITLLVVRHGWCLWPCSMRGGRAWVRR